MQIDFVDSNVKFTDRYKARLITKFSSVIDKYLNGMSEDLKLATLSIHKNMRGSYELKFNMEKVPFAKIYIHHVSPDLLPGIVELRDQVKRQIRENIAKIRDSSR
ncbi:hypothetical protein A3A84_03500 [Candidatus Collierbacteria bacterium RIFCSPLOWO2_01_FULL_50_23]|uniref:Ribosomal subunit interface protein n=2 Tax=Candidatus Collieribacteriota TaxID=1752725 RepID=A0A1F5ETB4_9BACT|nr:MAG: hypothetical protein A3D09_00080 [Candidatus Collierbacteria bacterium RIFCSPHIGHO2_02_FULL_49_10]OGD72073.1 MAG: hypothetical protein A2703_03810 [Candidatus Collierbacteria bacterium RIFCSPHIGHO2_01_FULL_50_25]OGD75220.1 MAG: hypothetical protein A3A84_03500 [Candidatus Collierbacteria bacterium RIFCSPLOWO2_01_FULL_50_23]